MTVILSLLQASLVFGTVILYGSLGEILTEKAGHLNLGVPGVMYIGGIAGLAGAYFYESSAAVHYPFVGMLVAIAAAVLASALIGLLYGFLTISLRANQNVTGLTITIFGSGLANLYGGVMNKLAGGVGQVSLRETSAAFRWTLPFLREVSVLSQLGFMFYLALILAALMNRFLMKSRAGLNLRAIGEHPAAADAMGVNVSKYKYSAVIIGSIISGLGGLYYVMDYTAGTWSSDGGIEALGWLAVALVIFARWKPLNAVWGAYLFGFFSRIYLYIPGLTRSTIELTKGAPYLVTIFVLVGVSLKKSPENEPPKALGLPYFREER